MTKVSEEKQAEINHAREQLEKMCPPGSTIYGQFIDSNGQGTRTYTFFVVYDGEMVCLDYYLHTVLGYQFRETSHAARGLRTQDDGYQTVLHLSYELFGVHTRHNITEWNPAGDPNAYTYRRL